MASLTCSTTGCDFACVTAAELTTHQHESSVGGLRACPHPTCGKQFCTRSAITEHVKTCAKFREYNQMKKYGKVYNDKWNAVALFRASQIAGTVGGKTVWNAGLRTSGTPRKRDGVLRQFRSNSTTPTLNRTSKRKRTAADQDEDAEDRDNGRASSNEDENTVSTDGEEDAYQPKKASRLSSRQRSVKDARTPPARRKDRSASRKTDESETGKSASTRSTSYRTTKKRGSLKQSPSSGDPAPSANQNVGDSEEEPDPLSDAHHFWEMAQMKKARDKQQAEDSLGEDYERQPSARLAMRQREVKLATGKHATMPTDRKTVGAGHGESPTSALGGFKSGCATNSGPPDKQTLPATTANYSEGADGANSKLRSDLASGSQDPNAIRGSGQAERNILSQLQSRQTRRSTRNSSFTPHGSSDVVKGEGDSNKVSTSLSKDHLSTDVAKEKEAAGQPIAQAVQSTPSPAQNTRSAGKEPAQEKKDKENYKIIMRQRQTQKPLAQPAKSKGKKKDKKVKAAQRFKENKSGESPTPVSARTVRPVSNAQADTNDFVTTRYHCTCCDTTFTGLSAAQSHMFSSTVAMLAEQIVIPPGYYYG